MDFLGLSVCVDLLQRTGVRAGTILLLSVLIPSSCFAGLGGDLNSVVNDQIHLKGSLRSVPMGQYTIHEITIATGAVVKEYISPGGTVFAVTWRGPWPPDMQQLLGSYFQRYANAVHSQAAAQPGRRPVRMAQPDFVFEMTGHPRSFAGRAYLPEMLPPNVQAEVIQ